MEQIKNIEIKNFKSIRHVEIEDCRRINVFIGYPNVGKSNILEALSLFSIDRSNFDFSSVVRMENFTTLFFNGEIQRKAEVILNKNYRCSAQHRGNKIEFECEKDKKQVGFDILDKEIEYSKLKVAGYSINIDNSIISSFVGGVYSEFNVPVLKKYKFPEKLLPVSFYSSSLIHPNGNNIFEIISTNEQLRKDVVDLFKLYNLNFSFDKSTQSFKILKFVGNDIFLIPFSMIADTLQRLIFYKAAMFSNKETVLLFEEPEAHMFPPYLSKFTTDAIFDESKNQYFINTHSPFVLNDFMEELEREQLAIFAVGYKKETGETMIRKLTDKELDEIYQYGIDLFFNLENYLMNEA